MRNLLITNLLILQTPQNFRAALQRGKSSAVVTVRAKRFNKRASIQKILFGEKIKRDVRWLQSSITWLQNTSRDHIPISRDCKATSRDQIPLVTWRTLVVTWLRFSVTWRPSLDSSLVSLPTLLMHSSCAIADGSRSKITHLLCWLPSRSDFNAFLLPCRIFSHSLPLNHPPLWLFIFKSITIILTNDE